MPGVPVRNHIQLGGIGFKLARGGQVGQTGARSWAVKTNPQPLTPENRSDVAPGAVSGEYRIVWDHFDKGIGTDITAPPGTIGVARLIRTGPGYAAMVNRTESLNITAPGGFHTFPLVFGSLTFIIAGRYALLLNGDINNSPTSVDRDFGAGVFATDAVVHNDELVVCFGGSTNQIIKRASGAAGGWTATGGVYADLFAKVEDRLWRVTNGNEISNIGPTDDPQVATNWSGAITVGDDDYGCTDLNALGDQLAVSKPDGLYLGDASLTFPNVLPQLVSAPDPDNGHGTLVVGGTVFYPHRRGLLVYDGSRSVESGIQLQYAQTDPTENALITPGTQILALAALGDDLYAVTMPSGLPFTISTNNPTVLITTDGGASYTDRTAAARDRDVIDDTNPAGVDLSNLDTAANGDYLLIGFSINQYPPGVYLTIGNPNSNAAVMTPEFWNGTTWVALGANEGFYDGTTLSSLASPGLAGSASLARSGFVFWSASPHSTATTINGVSARWLRLRWSAALDAGVKIREIRAVGANGGSATLWHGRKQRPQDPWTHPIVWEVLTDLNNVNFPSTGVGVLSTTYPYHAPGVVVTTSPRSCTFVYLPDHAQPMPMLIQGTSPSSNGGFFWLPKHGGGAPWINKQFTRIWASGDGLSAAYPISVGYRTTDGISAFSLLTLDSSGGTAAFPAATTGYWVQPRVTFGALDEDATAVQRLTRLEIAYRLVPGNLVGFHQDSYQLVLDLGGGSVGLGGGVTLGAVDAAVALLGFRGTAQTLLDPLNRSRVVIVDSVDLVEYQQEGREIPLLFATVQCSEVA